MGDSLRKSPKRMSFSEWTERFVYEIADHGSALEALKRITRSEAEREAVIELLFHHVHDAQAEMELFDRKLPTANLATFPTI
jgi:hypothetical protein